jgi:hypothetical protein
MWEKSRVVSDWEESELLRIPFIDTKEPSKASEEKSHGDNYI